MYGMSVTQFVVAAIMCQCLQVILELFVQMHVTALMNDPVHLMVVYPHADLSSCTVAPHSKINV